jgi:hypothetical protein
MSIETDFAAITTLHPVGAMRKLRNTGTTRRVQAVGHRMALDCPCVEVRVDGRDSSFLVKAHELRRVSAEAAVQKTAHKDVILGRDLHAVDKPVLDAFYMMIQARYGRRAANAAIDATEDAITKVRSENRERGIDD